MVLSHLLINSNAPASPNHQHYCDSNVKLKTPKTEFPLAYPED